MHWSFWRCSSNKGTVSQEESAIPAATESLLCTLRMNHETGFIFFSDSPSKFGPGAYGNFMLDLFAKYRYNRSLASTVTK